MSGLAVGILLGANRFLSKAFENYLYYLGPTPKIIFFPVMIMWFGVGPASKIAFGVSHGFFPIIVAIAAGVQNIKPILLTSAKSMGATRNELEKTAQGLTHSILGHVRYMAEHKRAEGSQ